MFNTIHLENSFTKGVAGHEWELQQQVQNIHDFIPAKNMDTKVLTTSFRSNFLTFF